MTTYNDFIARKEREYGNKFDPSDLPAKFIPFYENNYRIEVKYYGELERGRVGITTGWKPAFLLMHRTSDHGSSTLLNDNYEITKVICK